MTAYMLILFPGLTQCSLHNQRSLYSDVNELPEKMTMTKKKTL